jgi:hypothetical protein
VHIQGGEIVDVALKELLRCIRYYRLGESGDKSLVIIATRQSVVELEKWDGYMPIDLQVLSDQDGANLLRSLNVKGYQADLKMASHDMGGHALGLVLMGRLLVERFHGEIRRRDQLPDLFEETLAGENALRVLRYYDEDYWQSANFIQRFYHRLIENILRMNVIKQLKN